jgi:hypothetical protein
MCPLKVDDTSWSSMHIGGRVISHYSIKVVLTRVCTVTAVDNTIKQWT